MRTRRKRYSPEFKREALRRASEEGVTDVQVWEELGASARQLRRWRDELRLHGESAFPGHGKSHDQELTKLRRELATVKQCAQSAGVAFLALLKPKAKKERKAIPAP